MRTKPLYPNLLSKRRSGRGELSDYKQQNTKRGLSVYISPDGEFVRGLGRQHKRVRLRRSRASGNLAALICSCPVPCVRVGDRARLLTARLSIPSVKGRSCQPRTVILIREASTCQRVKRATTTVG